MEQDRGGRILLVRPKAKSNDFRGWAEEALPAFESPVCHRSGIVYGRVALTVCRVGKRPVERGRDEEEEDSEQAVESQASSSSDDPAPDPRKKRTTSQSDDTAIRTLQARKTAKGTRIVEYADKTTGQVSVGETGAAKDLTPREYREARIPIHKALRETRGTGGRKAKTSELHWNNITSHSKLMSLQSTEFPSAPRTTSLLAT